MFSQKSPRFDTYAVIDRIPGRMIDTVWYLIDQNLTGVVKLGNLINFEILADKDGKSAMMFSQKNKPLKIKFDLPIKYDPSYPASLVVYDDGVNQTVMLPSEVK